MTAVEKLLDRLEGVRRTGEGRWQALCPAHGDRHPSLSITEKPNGDLLVHDHAGCELEGVLAAVELEKRDLFAESSSGTGHREIEAIYPYVDEAGEPLFEVVRFAGKQFRQRRDAETWKLNGVRRALYRLPRVLQAVERGEDVMIVEGEKDVHALEKLGIVATCNPGGAGKWKSLYNDFLNGAKVTIIADRDEPGREHARAVAQALQGVAAEVDVVEFTKGKDAAEHFANGGTIADVVPLLGEVSGVTPLERGTDTPRYKGRRLDMSALLAEPDEPIPWRCHGIAADGYLTTIAGRGGEGKSWLTLALAHGVHRGGTVAGISCTKGTPIVFDAENGAELLKRRFRAAGIAAGSVQPYDADGLSIVRDLDWFKGEIESEGAHLAIFDSLRILSSGADENNTEEIEPIMSALRRLARETGAAIVLVHHRGRDESSSYRGSSAIRDGTDMLFKFGRVKDDPEARHRRVLETVKCRIDEEPEPRWLRIEADRAAGLVYVDEAEPYEGGTTGATVRAEVADELLELLTEEPQTMASLAREVGRDPKDATVRRALKALEEAGRAERTEAGWRGVSVSTAKGVTPDTPHSKAENGNGHLDVHFSSETSEWATPQDLFDELDAEFGFTLDVCATDANAKCERYFTAEVDGLAQEWTGTCWMNPPYGREIGRWVRKAAESAQHGATVVCLVPARTDTAWWHDYCARGEARLLRGRLKFGDATNSAPFPSAVVVFGALAGKKNGWSAEAADTFIEKAIETFPGSVELPPDREGDR